MTTQQELDELKLRLAAIIVILPSPGDGEYGNTVGDLLSALRVQVQYLIFDSEVTRRENKYLRKMLEDRWQDRPPGGMHQPS